MIASQLTTFLKNIIYKGDIDCPVGEYSHSVWFSVVPVSCPRRLFPPPHSHTLLVQVNVATMFRRRSLVLCTFIAVTIGRERSAHGFATSTRHRLQHDGLCITSPITYQTRLAAKGGGKKKAAARTTKGFGAPPPSLVDVVAQFRTRMPEDADAQPCPCGSGDTYGVCCAELHRKERQCLTMTDVLRSRYSAFAWRDVSVAV
jgi:hypothetical protein